MPDEYPRPLDPPSSWDGPLRIGLLGSKIADSLSPRIHELACDHHGIPLEFKLLDHPSTIDPGILLRKLHADGLRGISVTMPFKTRLDEHLNGMSPAAISTGAVNLLVRSESGWVGDNSDPEGFLAPLATRRLQFRSALLAGCGGAARAVAHVLSSMPFVEDVYLRCRRPDQARLLKEEFETEETAWHVLDWIDERDPGAELLINASPIGMAGDPGLPTPAAWLAPGRTAYDLVYRPRLTPWLQAARERNCDIIEGLEMLVGQARPAFRAWTGKQLPADEILKEFGLC